VRSSRPYIRTRDTIEGGLSRLGTPGRFLVGTGERMRDSMKLFLIGGTLFEDMGITYLGPVDGHSINSLREVMLASQEIKGPVLIHAFSKKGKGYLPAEADPELFHGAARFDVLSGRFLAKAENKSYTEHFSEALIDQALANERIVAITAAMPKGTGLDCFEQRFAGRFFDVGIAEEHAVALAAGMALGGRRPVVAIYSSFLQRAFDQIMTNVCLMKQNVVFCLDRAGLVGDDGTTHHGVFDLAYLRAMPNMRIMAPATASDLRLALATALHLDGPVALRFPRGEAFELPGLTEEDGLLPEGKGQQLRAGSDVALLALGGMVKPALAAAELLAQSGISAAVYNMLWVKPLDKELLTGLADFKLIVTIEEGTLSGGFGSAVLEELARTALSDRETGRRIMPVLLRIGLPDEFIAHGTIAELHEQLGLDAPGLAAQINAAL
jgi:1-deoxy-D-xylulose-5-phosphate synthase